jgi:hypothetical protein
MLTVNGEEMSKSRGTSSPPSSTCRSSTPATALLLRREPGPQPRGHRLSLKEFRLKVTPSWSTTSQPVQPGPVDPLHQAGRQALRRPQRGAARRRPQYPARRARRLLKLELRTAVRAVVELGERTNKFVQDSRPWEKVAARPRRPAATCPPSPTSPTSWPRCSRRWCPRSPRRSAASWGPGS